MDDKRLYIITRDGTMVPLLECLVIGLTLEEADSLLDKYSDGDRYEMAVSLLSSSYDVNHLLDEES